MKLKLDYKKIISEVITASLIIIISGIAIYSFIVISDQNVDVYNSSPKVDAIKGNNKIQEVLSIIQSKYMENVDVNQLVDGAIEGIFNSIEDDYTRYITPEEYEEMLKEGNEEYVGIGVHISQNTKTGSMVVISVMPNSPAKEAGIMSGDMVLSVDDIIVTKDTYSEAVNALKDKEGTVAKLVIQRGEEKINKEVTRKKITSSNVESDVIDNKYGYIRVLEFENNIYNQFKEEYTKLMEEKKVEGLIIDLRNNPGGIVSETVKIADLLCGEGKIVETVYRDGSKRVYTSDAATKCLVPIVVLVNENSASASEILAGAIKDLKQGTLVGKKTFGKGIVQSIVPLNEGGAVSVTTAKYYTASGIEIHGNGITPDVEVDISDINRGLTVDYNKDEQLRKAVEILNKGN